MCCSLVFYSLVSWFSSSSTSSRDSKDTKESKESKETLLNDTYYVRPNHIQIHSITNRTLSEPLIWCTRILLFSWASSYLMEKVQERIQDPLLKLVILGFGFLFEWIWTLYFLSPSFSSDFEFKTTKSLLCAGVGSVLIGIATINPSLSVFMSCFLVPVLLSLTRKSLFSFLSLILISPTGLFVITSVYMQSTREILNWIVLILHQWELYGSMLAPLVIYLYWPFILLSFSLII